MAILLGAVFGGMWLDSRFGTKPTWTVILVLASIPLSVICMVLAARTVSKRIHMDLEKELKQKTAEEESSSDS
ncbi:MAG: AtpZ/AtpI family protein [Anaerolineaceae bacterium]|nr:AtpZ/AtpI family protein [Anaerolineaceae bacterium]